MSNATLSIRKNGLMGCVGGLVGQINGASNITGCEISHSNIAGYSYVGGLVSSANWEDDLVQIQNCCVRNCSISADIRDVGGLIGTFESNSLKVGNCSVVNCSISSGIITDSLTSGVGGLVGYARNTGNSEFVRCNVSNCIISSGQHPVGGLVGVAESMVFTDCCAENCTIVETKPTNNFVGGLVGLALTSVTTLNGCCAKYCAVAGNGDMVNMITGSGTTTGALTPIQVIVDNSSSTGDIISVWNGTTYVRANAIGNTDGNPVNFFRVTGAEYYSNGTDSGKYTNLGRYMQIGGFGYGSAVLPVFSVTCASVQNGTITASPVSGIFGATIDVTATQNPGYHLNWTYWNKSGVLSSEKHPFTRTFSLPAYDVDVSGDFMANVTNVTFYNLTIPIESKLNTYKETTNATPSAPTRIGHTFAGWNVSAENGLPFNGTGYNESGIWKYTGPHYTGGSEGILNVYANWTPFTYNVTFSNTTGSGIMENQTLTYDVAASLQPNTFTKSGYTFAGWNKTSASGTAIDFANQATVMNLTAVDKGAVDLYAVWTENTAQYTPSSSKQTGYTIILPGEEVAAPANVTETPEPTIVPTVKPTTQPTQQSPAPFLGILAGLGAAAVVLRLRK